MTNWRISDKWSNVSIYIAFKYFIFILKVKNLVHSKIVCDKIIIFKWYTQWKLKKTIWFAPIAKTCQMWPVIWRFQLHSVCVFGCNYGNHTKLNTFSFEETGGMEVTSSSPFYSFECCCLPYWFIPRIWVEGLTILHRNLFKVS